MSSPHGGPGSVGLPDGVRAALFDLDGVLTDTASVHASAWKEMFDGYLKDRAQQRGEEFTPFGIKTDYPAYVDGKRRQDGTRSFLESRGIHLPDGTPDDPPDAETINGLGNRKNALVQEKIQKDGVTVFPGTEDYLQAVKDAGLHIAVVSSSANTAQVLHVTGLERFVEQRVDAQLATAQNLKGKPAPDTFVEGARLFGLQTAEAAVFEDALAGVEAGHAGHFGIVVGVNRVGDGHGPALKEHGADVVVTNLIQLRDHTEDAGA